MQNTRRGRAMGVWNRTSASAWSGAAPSAAWRACASAASPPSSNAATHAQAGRGGAGGGGGGAEIDDTVADDAAPVGGPAVEVADEFHALSNLKRRAGLSTRIFCRVAASGAKR